MIQEQRIEKPSSFQFIAEHFKVWKEIWESRAFEKKYQFKTNGDGHPVLVLPGFMSSDLATARLRKLIEELGYTPYPWELGRNLGDIRQLPLIFKKIESLHNKHQTKVSLIGWSLGGVYARQLAKREPSLIRQIITMGSPFAGIHHPNNATWLFTLLHNRRNITETDEEWVADLPAPAPVPTTAIYSKEDGVVPWQTCMEVQEDDLHQNIEVSGGHLGMSYNPSVWMIVEDRLQYGSEDWRKYDGA